MDVSKQQKVILEAAMTAPGAFRPKYMAEKAGLAYDIICSQLGRLVAKKILVKDKEARTYTVAEDARKEWWNSPEAAPTEESAGPSPYQPDFRSLVVKIELAIELRRGHG